MSAPDQSLTEYLTNQEQAMYAPFFGSLGVSAAMMFTAAGSAYGTAKSGTGISSMAVARPDLVMKAIIPVVMAGIVAIYGLVVAVIISGKVQAGGAEYTINNGFSQFAGGLVCGLCGLGAGYAIGIAGDAGVRALSQQPRFFVGMILILIFAEVLGLYGMIVALILGATHSIMSYDLDVSEHAAYAPFFGYMGAASAQIFTVLGAAYGTAKSAVGISSMGVMRPELIMKSVIPVIMAGIIGIYGLVVAMVLKGKVQSASDGYTLDKGFAHLAAGLTCGLCGLGAGYAIGIVGDAGVRGTAQQPRLFVGMILILIFSEVLGLYGMIVALILGTS